MTAVFTKQTTRRRGDEHYRAPLWRFRHSGADYQCHELLV